MKYVSLEQLSEMLEVSKVTILRWERLGEFPTGYRINKRCIRWDLDEVEAWMRTKQEA